MIRHRSYVISTFVLVAIILGVILDISLLYPFISSVIFSLIVLSRMGKPLKDLWLMIYEGLMECRVLFLLILLIGANISVWMSSGVVPAIMYYGFEYMKGINFIFMAFLITSIMSIFMGTAVGTISTLGIALLGIGKGFAIPQEILVGVLVSAAFIADKISPISGLLNLTLKITNTSYKQTIKSMLKTLIPVYTVTAIIYYIIGSQYGAGEDLAIINVFQTGILQGFRISPWLLLLPLCIVLLPLRGVKIIPTILAGLGGGIIITLLFQGGTLIKTFKHILWGFEGSTPSPELNSILISGGVIGMVEVVFIVASVIALSSLLERSGILKPIIFDPIAKVKTKGELILKTGLVGSLLTVVTCDQTVGIVLPGKLYKEKYMELEVDNTVLARTISDTSTIIAPLMPWNVNGIIIGLITGISAMQYAPYAILCYLFPATVVWIYFRKMNINGSGEYCNSLNQKEVLPCVNLDSTEKEL